MALPSPSASRPPAAVLSACAIGVGLLGAVGLAAFGTVVGALGMAGRTPWWFWLSMSHTTAIIGFYASLGLLAAGWAALGVQAHRGELRLAGCWAALAAWGTPLLLGPPLFSRDLYSYVVQGLLAKMGRNPYTTSPAVLRDHPVYLGIATVWRHTPAPYGPLSVLATLASAAASGRSGSAASSSRAP